MTILEKILDWCSRQVGTKEQPPGSNNVTYNTTYYGGPVSGPAYPWCCAFLWVAFYENNASHLFCGGEKTAYCPYVVNYAKQHNQWVDTGYKPGDLVFFDWDFDGVADHIGIVESVLGSAVTTIEGNVNEAVCRMNRSELGIMGAFRPSWPEGEQGDHSEDEKDEPALPGSYIVQKGDTLWGIAEKMYGAGQGYRYAQIMSANNMTSDAIYPGDILIIPDSSATVYRTIQVTITNDTYELLSIMADGWNKTIGQVIDALMEDAV